MKRVLIYFDYDHHENSLELLSVAKKIYPTESLLIHAVNPSNQNHVLMGRVNSIINCHTHVIDPYDYGNMTQWIADLHQTYDYHCILFPSSKNGRIIAPRVAMRLHVGLVADITDIQFNNGKLEIIRPAYGGKIMAAIECLKEPMMMSVRQNVFSQNDYVSVETDVIEYAFKDFKTNPMKCINRVDKNDLIQDIRESKILVSGGYGIVENFNQIYELANELKAHVSASRKIVDHGVVSRKIQVGQSGKTVSPDLYIALGISGSTQHIEGLRNIETIISVNSDEYAPLNSIADIVVLGDAIEFTNQLIQIIKKERKGS
jgi:electron transfer flavoprotein alpha subunit